MKEINVLNLKNILEFRAWLEKNADMEKCCYIKLKRGKPQNDDKLYYLDAVEIALCFGWIDSTLTKINGESFQKFTTRKENSLWTELNKERVRRLEKLNLMTDRGRKVLPDMNIYEVIVSIELNCQTKCNT